MTEEEFEAALDGPPQVGETFEHLGTTYECTTVEWLRDEFEINVTYKKKWTYDSPKIQLRYPPEENDTPKIRPIKTDNPAGPDRFA